MEMTVNINVSYIDKTSYSAPGNVIAELVGLNLIIIKLIITIPFKIQYMDSQILFLVQKADYKMN